MTRKLIVPLTLALTLAIAAVAWAGSFSDNDYQGRIEKDKGTFFGFDVNKKNGSTKLSRFETIVKLQCSNGENGQVFLVMKGSLKANDDGSFKGTLSAIPQSRGGVNARALISGELQKRGKAKGRLDVSYNFAEMARGGQNVHCYSGAVDWKTKRGAIVNPQPQGPRPLSH